MKKIYSRLGAYIHNEVKINLFLYLQAWSIFKSE